MNIYVVLALFGTTLAVGGALWYYMHRSAKEVRDLNTAIAANSAQAAKIKTLDQQIVDAEYKKRAEEKRRNDAIVKAGDAGAATKLLHDATSDDPTDN